METEHTSKCGSADVLGELGINIDMDVSKIENCLQKIGICFMFAPNHHPAMKYVGSVRQQLGIRTIFNMLGPLMDPQMLRINLSAFIQVKYLISIKMYLKMMIKRMFA